MTIRELYRLKLSRVCLSTAARDDRANNTESGLGADCIPSLMQKWSLLRLPVQLLCCSTYGTKHFLYKRALCAALVGRNSLLVELPTILLRNYNTT